MREELHSDDKLGVFLHIDEDNDLVELELESRDDAIDLRVDDEVILFKDGQRLPIEADSSSHATARLGTADEIAEQSFGLMLRVYEFFEGWEFGGQ